MVTELREKLTRGVLWFALARVGTNAIGFMSTIVLARLLIPADFGLVAIAWGFLAVLGGITAISTDSILLLTDEPTEDQMATAWTVSILRAVLVAILVAAAARPLAWMYADERLFSVMLALAGTVIISGVINPRLALLYKRLEFKQNLSLDLISKIVTAVTSATVAYITRSYWALVIGGIAGQLTSLTIAFIRWPYKPYLTLKHARQVIRFSSWLSLSSLMQTLNFRVDHLIMGGLLGKDALGKYLISDQLSALPTRELGWPIAQVLFPGLAAIRNDPSRQRTGYLRMQSTLFALLAPAGVGLALIADPVVPLILSEKWRPIVPLVQVMGCLYAAHSIQLVMQPLAMSADQTRMLFMRDLATFIVRVPLVLIGIYAFGLWGVLMSRAGVIALAIAITLHAGSKLVGASILTQLAGCTRAFVALLVMSAVVSVAKNGLGLDDDNVQLILKAVLLVTLGVISYAATSWSLWKLSGCPEGPESTLLSALREFFRGGQRSDRVQ